MKKGLLFIYVVYIFLFISGSTFGVGEKTISLGGESAWRMIESMTNVTEVGSVRPYSVLVLSSATGTSTAGYSAATGVLGNFSVLTESAHDMSVSFDEREPGLFRDSIGRYRVSASLDIEAVDRRYARAGTGAVLFGGDISSGSNPLVIEPQSRNALFAPGNRIRDFTIEFWLYPLNMENGEQILSWVSSKQINGNNSVQRIRCSASRNRLQWSFSNFFTSANGVSHINVEFSGNAPVVPKQWSHHLIRFDAGTGMLEYVVDGSSEAICYATPSGREGGEVYTPVTGNDGIFLLGERFMGLIDEFKIHNVFAGRSSIQRYAASGGRAETKAVDLGGNSSGVVMVDVSGGRTGVNNEFRENGRFRFSDDTEMNFFIRASENAYLLNECPWINFTPGVNITGIKGRYVQIAVDFYPSSDGETSPYLEQLRIIYLQGEPPMPPRNVIAVAVDGGVLLRWRRSPDANTAGYLVYYSAARGELFGEDAALGPSPIDAGNTDSLFIDGLKNGVLYYFRIASYDYISGSGSYNAGIFSAEVTARPLAGLSISGSSYE
ncbi:MAG: hypothetical protein LBQ89_07010 [Treponema sp.]|jgi:hypothetical protein|nr:hypothetical protein [Treponema sp.]